MLPEHLVPPLPTTPASKQVPSSFLPQGPCTCFPSAWNTAPASASVSSGLLPHLSGLSQAFGQLGLACALPCAWDTQGPPAGSLCPRPPRWGEPGESLGELQKWSRRWADPGLPPAALIQGRRLLINFQGKQWCRGVTGRKPSVSRIRASHSPVRPEAEITSQVLREIRGVINSLRHQGPTRPRRAAR